MPSGKPKVLFLCRLVPGDGMLVQSSEPVRSASSVKASWEIQTKSDPATYFRWLKRELGPAYHTAPQTDSTLSLVGTGGRFVHSCSHEP